MAPIHHPDKGADREQVLQRLEDLYKGDNLDENDHGDMGATITHGTVQDILTGPNGYDPSVTIPKIILYLQNNDVGRDVDWSANFTLIRGYLADAHRRMVTGGLGFGDPKLRAALEDARVMVRVHLNFERRAREKSRWTDGILRGQTTQERLLTYPRVFPLPEPDRAKSYYQRVKPTPRPSDYSSIWKTTLKVTDPAVESSVLAEVDNYVDSENRFFESSQNSAKTNKNDESVWENNIFALENRAYEKYVRGGPTLTSAERPPGYIDNHKGSKETYYGRRGWQRAALQQCLNLFTSHENRVINTPWRRPVLPYEPPAPLPKDIAYVPRVVEPREVKKGKEKDPFSWLHWSYQYTQIVDFLASCQRRKYNYESWDNFSAPALPANFRGPRIYRGLTVHDQHWLRIGDYLEKLEDLIHKAWGAAPRPLLRAILRDIDAGRHENTGGPNMDNSHYLPAEDDDDMHDRKRYWRRDIRRRVNIDNREDNTNDDNFKLIDDVGMVWLRFLCEPSRTLEMCDPSRLPPKNLAIIFDAKLQSYFKDLEASGHPDSKALSIWGENYDDIDEVKRKYEPNSLRTVLAYINGCTDSELVESGDRDSNPEHPNACYQYSLEEAEFLCVELHNLGRCVYMPKRGQEPARVDRPSYNVHPEDRVRWRYDSPETFHALNEDYLNEMVDHYDATYGNWSLYFGNRPRFSRELEFMLDHTGPDFHYELERVETQEQHPATSAALSKRREFIKGYLVPEGLWRMAEPELDSVEDNLDLPYNSDLAPWEAVGAYLTEYREQHKDKHNSIRYYNSGDLYHPQTPERTVQFFRNLAYRAGRTMRYVDQIKDRLQYLQTDADAVTIKAPLDLSADLKEPRPEDVTDMDAVPTHVVVEKWWQAIPVKDYDFAIERWNTAIREGSGEVELLPPGINEVLVRADPESFKNPPSGTQDAFTIIREGIIDDCFQNRPTMYPGRLSGFKDQTDKDFQGYERPSLFDWATKDQRRYQAPHTRRHFFNMQRWPLSRILPHRLEAIRARKDEVARIDPSKPDQAYGILTNRVPIGTEKPLYAHPLTHHGPDPDPWRDFGLSDPYIATDPTLLDPSAGLLGGNGEASDESDPELHDIDPDDGVNNSDKNLGNDKLGSGLYDADTDNSSSGESYNSKLDPEFYDIEVNFATMPDNESSSSDEVNEFFDSSEPSDNDTDTGNAGDTAGAKGATGKKGSTGSASSAGTPAMKGAKGMMGAKPTTGNWGSSTKPGLVPFARNTEKFAAGPAVFPMGDTLLQKVLISHELNNALYPAQPFYKSRLLGLPKVWQKIVSGKVPLVPLVPPTARSNIPRSNPRKRKMPIEFLNSSAVTKKFRSDSSMPLQPGGNGGQFAAATVTVTTPHEGHKMDADSDLIPKALQSIAKTGATMGGNTMNQPIPTTTSGNNMTQPTPTTAGGNNMTQPTPATAGGNNMSTGAAGTTGQEQSALSFPSLRVYPNPSRRRAREQFVKKFPGRWSTTNAGFKFLMDSAIFSFHHSLTYQCKELDSSVVDVNYLHGIIISKQWSELNVYAANREARTYFDMFAAARLLEAFGELQGLKFQLGVVQEDVDKQLPYALPMDTKKDKRIFCAYLVGSKYDKDPEKQVIWLRLMLVNRGRRHVNPYNGLEYNNYEGVNLYKDSGHLVTKDPEE